jgi:uncharacterized membrane protein
MTKKVLITFFWLVFFGFFLYKYIPNATGYLTQGFPSFAGDTWLNNRLWFALHITSGLFVYVIGIIQFTSAIRNRYVKLHRVLGKIYIICSLISILTLAFMIPYGLCKPCKISQTVVTSLWLLFVVLAYYFIRQRKIVQHQRMMISSFICAAYFVTVRVIDKFTMPFFYSITKTENQALLVSDIAVWLLPLVVFWSVWLIKDKIARSKISVSSI